MLLVVICCPNQEVNDLTKQKCPSVGDSFRVFEKIEILVPAAKFPNYLYQCVAYSACCFYFPRCNLLVCAMVSRLQCHVSDGNSYPNKESKCSPYDCSYVWLLLHENVQHL